MIVPSTKLICRIAWSGKPSKAALRSSREVGGRGPRRIAIQGYSYLIYKALGGLPTLVPVPDVGNVISGLEDHRQG